MKKHLFFLTVLFTITVNSFLSAQSVSVWDGTSEMWTQGQGTESSPYLIENAQQLAFIAEMVNGGVTHYDNTWFKLTTNVYIDSTTSWQPIGSNGTYYFGGNFDGDDHTVTLYLSSSLQYVGIFGYIKYGIISNLNSAGWHRIITSSSNPSYIGGICGYSTSSFSNCQNTGSVSIANSLTDSFTNDYIGGICGYSLSTFTNCYNSGDIFSSSSVYSHCYAGGICGYSPKTNLTLLCTNCHNTGNISSILASSSSHAGGICGCGSNCILCSNIGNVSSSWKAGGICADVRSVTNCYNMGGISSELLSGGICGTGNSISHCYNSGDIYSNQCAGGVCGRISTITSTSYSNTYCNVTNCYNTGSISAGTIAGGVSGGCSTNDGTHDIINCYNVGFLLSGTSKGGIYASGNINVTNCYFLNTCGHNTSTGGTAKTEAQMKSPSFPIILNTDSVVFVMDVTPNINQGYPVFGSVSTLDASNITPSTATLNGYYQMLYDVDAHGFEYKKSNESSYTTVNSTGEAPVSYQLGGLQGGTQYTYRFFVQKDGITYRGSDKTFNTTQCTLSAQIEASSNILCAGDTLTYTVVANSSSTAPYQYAWNTGENTNAITVADGANYTVTVTDIYGCTTTANKQMTLYPAVNASITGSTVLCNGGNTTLTANGGTYYSWNTGSLQRSVSVNQPGTYIATVTSIYGCTASDTVVVTTFDNPVITGNLVFCSGEYTTLTATGGDSYVWSTGATTSSINVNTEGSYTVTANTSSGCSGSATVNVIQLQTNEATITGNSLICSGIGTVLTASSGSSYLWSTGETTPSISVNNPGTYFVTVTNSYGCSSSATQTVSLMEPTTISGNSHICSGGSTTLTATGTGNYQWSNGVNTPSITVNTPGTYSVTVSLPNGCSSSAAIEVTAASSPTPSISGNNVICEGQSTTLTATGGNNYSWNNGSTQNSIVVTQSGNYTVTVTNTDGCSASTSTTVTVNPLPNVTISGSSSFCQGGSTTLTASGANTYLWSNASTNAAITINNAGIYTVTGTDINGCTNTASQTVAVNPTYNIPLTHSICEGESYNFYGQNLTSAGTYTHTLQTINGCDSVLILTLTVKTLPTASITGNTTICEGQSTTLTATGGNSYSWSTGSTNSSISVNQSGLYTVTATNTDGCSASTSTTVTVNPLPSITISGNTTVCQGSSTTLTASGADSYSWTTGENTASVSISSFGVYTVTGTSAEGCSSTADVTVLVSQLPVITISGEADFCAGGSTTLTANGGTSYLWSDGTTDASITVNTAGTYQVIGYNTAGCNSMESVTVNQWQPASSEFTITTNENCYEWNGQSYCQTGDYTQTLQTIHGCDSIVTLHLTIETGINDHNLNTSMNVYPNPTSDKVNVQLTEYESQSNNMEIQLFDIYGKLLQTVPASNENLQINLSSYAQGVYFIKAVVEGNVLAVRKVVKNR